MVFFTCNSCGESLKKNKVDKHLCHCSSNSFSCIDCNNDFNRYTYKSHVQCISEDQKYGGINYKPKENSSKGQFKQEAWIQKIKTAITDAQLPHHIKELTQRLLDYDNIPRKKIKFENFVRNSLRVRNSYYVEVMWELFENAIKDDSKSLPNNGTQQNNLKPDVDQIVDNYDDMPSKKCKTSAEMSEHNTDDDVMLNTDLNQDTIQCEDNSIKQKIKVSKLMKNILKNAVNNEISFKKLRKKIIFEYNSNGLEISKQEIKQKLKQTIEKSNKFVLNDKRVSLVT